MGMFGKPKTPDYAKINKEAADREKARIVEEEAQAKAAGRASLISAETKRKAFFSGLTDREDTEARRKFMKSVAG